MTKEEFAALLTGREYGSEITKAEEAQAKAARLVVVFGASDDLIEFRGAICDEFDCCGGGIAKFDAKGVLPERDNIEDDDALKDFFSRIDTASAIESLWDQDGYSWTYKTDISHATFEIVEGDEKYCRGIVFDINQLAPLKKD